MGDTAVFKCNTCFCCVDSEAKKTRKKSECENEVNEYAIRLLILESFITYELELVQSLLMFFNPIYSYGAVV